MDLCKLKCGKCPQSVMLCKSILNLIYPKICGQEIMHLPYEAPPPSTAALTGGPLDYIFYSSWNEPIDLIIIQTCAQHIKLFHLFKRTMKFNCRTQKKRWRFSRMMQADLSVTCLSTPMASGSWRYSELKTTLMSNYVSNMIIAH